MFPFQFESRTIPKQSVFKKQIQSVFTKSNMKCVVLQRNISVLSPRIGHLLGL